RSDRGHQTETVLAPALEVVAGLAVTSIEADLRHRAGIDVGRVHVDARLEPVPDQQTGPDARSPLLAGRPRGRGASRLERHLVADPSAIGVGPGVTADHEAVVDGIGGRVPDRVVLVEVVAV